MIFLMIKNRIRGGRRRTGAGQEAREWFTTFTNGHFDMRGSRAGSLTISIPY